MRISNMIIEAIARIRDFTFVDFDVSNRLAQGKDVYYWHTTDCVNYVRYQIRGEATKTNIVICADRTAANLLLGDTEGHKRHIVLTPSVFHFFECEGAIMAAPSGIEGSVILFLDNEAPARTRIEFTAVKVDE